MCCISLVLPLGRWVVFPGSCPQPSVWIRRQVHTVGISRTRLRPQNLKDMFDKNSNKSFTERETQLCQRSCDQMWAMSSVTYLHPRRSWRKVGPGALPLESRQKYPDEAVWMSLNSHVLRRRRCFAGISSALSQKFPTTGVGRSDGITEPHQTDWGFEPNHPACATRHTFHTGSIGSGSPRVMLGPAHVDVVPVTPDNASQNPEVYSGWEENPWSGTVAGGEIFGRGAVSRLPASYTLCAITPGRIFRCLPKAICLFVLSRSLSVISACSLLPSRLPFR